MQIGRRIYYDLVNGNVIVDTGERSGDVVETTIKQDFVAYVALAERVPSTVGCLQLEYGEYAQDFAECNGYRVDVSGDIPSLLFSYPDPKEPSVHGKPLSDTEDSGFVRVYSGAKVVRVPVRSGNRSANE